MKLLVLGINRSPEPVGIAPYTTGMTQWLAAKGHDVAMIAAQPYYPAWRIADGWSQRWATVQEDGVSVTRCPLYVPATPSGAKRILHHASFAATSLAPTLARARAMRADVVMTIAPSLLSAPVALAAARLTNAKSWLHIQDFEVDAAVATGLLRDGSAAVRRGHAFETAILKRFDRVSTISPRMCERLVAKGVAPDRIVEFRNWSDTDAIRPLEAPSSYRSRWGITTPHVALYSGNLANKQGIEIVTAAARRLVHRARDLTFIICGDGPSRTRLAAEVTDLPNVQLHDLQPYERLKDLLGLATVHLLPQVANAADLVLPSKLTNILASGRPVVATAEPGTGLYAEAHGCGIIVPSDDVVAFATAIQTLIDDSSLHATTSRAARIRAEERWSKDMILGRLESALLQVVG